MFFDLRGRMKNRKRLQPRHYVFTLVFVFLFSLGGGLLLERIFNAPFQLASMVLFVVGFVVTRVFQNKSN